MSNLSSGAARSPALTKLGGNRSWKDCCVVKNTFLDILDHEADGFHTLRRSSSEPHCGLSNGANSDCADSSYSSFDEGNRTNEASQHSPENSSIFNSEVPSGASSSMQPKPEVPPGASSSSSMQTAGAALYSSEASSSMQSRSTSDDQELPDPTTDMSQTWEPAWSAGAALHSTGDCKPCPWAFKPKGCSQGEMCDKCHLCDQGAYKQYRKNRLAGLKASRLKRKNTKSVGFVGDNPPNPGKFSL